VGDLLCVGTVVGSVSYSMAARDCGIAGWRCGGESGCRCRRGGVVRGWKTDISTASVCLTPSQIHRRGCIQVSGIHAPAARFMVEYQCCIHDPATTFLRPPTYHTRTLTTILRHSHTEARIWHQVYMCEASSRIKDPANQVLLSCSVSACMHTAMPPAQTFCPCIPRTLHIDLGYCPIDLWFPEDLV